MDMNEYLSHKDRLNQKRRQTVIKKNKDYSGVDDVFESFKQLAKMNKLLNVDCTTPLGCLIFFQNHKQVRKCNLTKNGLKPMNESVQDTLMDDLNYKELEIMCRIEMEGGENK